MGLGKVFVPDFGRYVCRENCVFSSFPCVKKEGR